MSNTEIAHFDLKAHTPSGLGMPFYELDEPLTVSLSVELTELDIDPSPTAEEPALPATAAEQAAHANAREIGPGALLGNRYQIERSIGAGGSAMLFSATDLEGGYVSSETEPRIALKVLHPELRHQTARIQRLMREFAYMRRLTHPFIARVFDLQTDAGVWFMVMELLPGRSLSRYLAEHSATGLSLRESVRILTECTEALICAHEHGVCHGDLKPGNVLIDASGGAHLIDFGAVSAMGTEPQGTLFATPAYASPQLLNQRIATPRDDLFSLGCVAYELFTGRHPFGLLSSLEARRQALQPAYHERIPAELFDAIKQLLAWEREFRPADALEFLNSLAAVEIATTAAADAQATTLNSESGNAIESPVTVELSDVSEQVAFKAPAKPRMSLLTQSKDLTHRAASQLKEFGQRLRGVASGWQAGVNSARPRQTLASVRHELTYAFAATASAISAYMPKFELSSSAGVSSDVASTAIEKRDNVPLAAVAGVAALAFMVLHWSNAARAPIRVPVAAPLVQESLAALVALPITMTEPTIAVPSPRRIEPPPPPPPPIRPANGRVWLTVARVHVAPGQQMAVVNLRRDKSTSGAAPVTWTIAPGSAKPGVDYETPKVRVARFNDGQNIRTLFIPIKPPKAGSRPERRFTIKLQKTPQGPEFGPITQTEVIIGSTG